MALLVIQTLNTHTYIQRLAIWSPSGPEWWLGFKVGQGPDWRTHIHMSHIPSHLHSLWIFQNSRLIQWNEQFWEFFSCPSLSPSTPSSLCQLASNIKMKGGSSIGYVWPLDGCGRRENDWFIKRYKENQSFADDLQMTDNFPASAILACLTGWWCICSNTRKCWCNWKHAWWHCDSNFMIMWVRWHVVWEVCLEPISGTFSHVFLCFLWSFVALSCDSNSLCLFFRPSKKKTHHPHIL